MIAYACVECGRPNAELMADRPLVCYYCRISQTPSLSRGMVRIAVEGGRNGDPPEGKTMKLLWEYLRNAAAKFAYGFGGMLAVWLSDVGNVEPPSGTDPAVGWLWHSVIAGAATAAAGTVKRFIYGFRSKT